MSAVLSNPATQPLSPKQVFRRSFWGRFLGVLRWPQLDALWERVRGSASGWYVYTLSEPPPKEPVSPEALTSFLREVDRHLRREHEHDYCGIVYADDLASPSMIKIYDPGNLGAACGSSGTQVLPRWLLSRVQPHPLQDTTDGDGKKRRGWWRASFGAGS